MEEGDGEKVVVAQLSGVGCHPGGITESIQEGSRDVGLARSVRSSRPASAMHAAPCMQRHACSVGGSEMLCGTPSRRPLTRHVARRPTAHL
mmetsp:Transcript_13852/g.40138  ORF Transcript_13852/g.40138 Transcript_13852/m.40138 type:complete len:91 (+) Transcript_13852:588-860(+)